MKDTARDEKLKGFVSLLRLWVKRNPDAVAGDSAGEDLLDLVRRIAALDGAKPQTRIALEAALREARSSFNDALRTTDKAAARIEALEAALRSIANKCPVTCDMTLAHEMAQEAEEALAALDKNGEK